MGEVNPHFKEGTTATDEYMYSDIKGKSNRAYYENKWYGFKKGSEETLREEYSTKHDNYSETQGFHIILLRMLFVLFLIIVFDGLKQYRHNQHEKMRKIKREVFQTEEKNTLVIKDKNHGFTIDLEEYMKERKKLYETDD